MRIDAAQWTERELRALRMLATSGRRLVRREAGWAVLPGSDLRRRPVLHLTLEEGARLMASNRITAATQGPGYMLADRPGEMEPQEPRPGPEVFRAVGAPSSRIGGAGFLGLARRAESGDGPLSLRAVQAGLRLVADAEASLRRPGLSMNWDAIPADRGRRAAGSGGLGTAARAAANRLAHVASRIGPTRHALVWAACVEGWPLSRLAAQRGLAIRRVGEALGEALEALADAYDAGGGPSSA
jgi:hypothetical protein